MTVSVGWGGTNIITVPQADLTPVSGTLYECDTNWLRLKLKDLEDDPLGMPFPKTHVHNPEVTVSGVTYSRSIEILPPYSIEFTPDSQWSVRLVGSNNNFFDVANGILVQNQVQVIPSNSGGLVNASPWSAIIEGSLSAEEMMRLMFSVLQGNATGLDSSSMAFKSLDGLKTRIAGKYLGGDRTITSRDPT